MRVVRTEDLKLVARLDREIFPHDVSLADDELEGGVWWVVRNGKEAVAFAGLDPFGKTPGTATFLRAGVLQAWRGRGLQKRLIDARLRWARRHGYAGADTYTSTMNIPSQRSLIARGFAPVRYEFDGESGWIYFNVTFRHTAPL